VSAFCEESMRLATLNRYTRSYRVITTATFPHHQAISQKQIIKWQ
jgi:hypothetical protein